MSDQNGYKAILETRLDELKRRLASVDSELDEGPNPDAEERAVEREGDEVLEGLGVAGVREISLIEAALKRIEDGTFGMCLSCGDPISSERLAAVPHAPTCSACAGARR